MKPGPRPGDTKGLTSESGMGKKKSIGYASPLWYIHLNNSGATLKSAPTVFLIGSINLFFLGLYYFVFCFQHTNSILEHSSRISKDKAGRAIVFPN